MRPALTTQISPTFVVCPLTVAGYGLPTTLGPDSRGAVEAGTSEGLPDIDEPEVVEGVLPSTAPFAFSRCGWAAAAADSTYGLAVACADARYSLPVAIADWTVAPMPLPALLAWVVLVCEVWVVLGMYD